LNQLLRLGIPHRLLTYFMFSKQLVKYSHSYTSSCLSFISISYQSQCPCERSSTTAAFSRLHIAIIYFLLRSVLFHSSSVISREKVKRPPHPGQLILILTFFSLPSLGFFPLLGFFAKSLFRIPIFFTSQFYFTTAHIKLMVHGSSSMFVRVLVAMAAALLALSSSFVFLRKLYWAQ